MSWQTQWKREHYEVVKHKADYFKPFWETKKGHWELIYPDFSEIEGLNCSLTVRCLDCGKVYMRKAGPWLIENNGYGCSNCYARRTMGKKIKEIEAKGFDVISAEMQENYASRIYKIRCIKCNSSFSKSGNSIDSWLNHGAKCPVCLKNKYLQKNGLPSNAMRIRKACVEGGFGYLEISERAYYDYKYVANCAAGHNGNGRGVEYIADVAEEMVKEKKHGNSRIGYQHH